MIDIMMLLTCAKKAAYQYGHSGLMMAIKSGPTELRVDDINTAHITGMRFTKIPVDKLVRAPAMSEGRICSDALSAEWPWTS